MDKGFPCVQQQTAVSYWCEIADPFHNGNKSLSSAWWAEHLNMIAADGASTEVWELGDMRGMSRVFPVIRCWIYATYFANANDERGPLTLWGSPPPPPYICMQTLSDFSM